MDSKQKLRPALFLPAFPHPTTTAVKYQEKILLLKRTENGESTNRDCSLSFYSTKKHKEVPNELEITKILNRQRSFYTIKRISENKYEFINRVDLHIMIYDGMMIKL